MDKTEKARAARRLLDDEAWLHVIKELRDDATRQFLNPVSSIEDREAAHEQVRAISAVERRLQNWETAPKMKDQQRGND